MRRVARRVPRDERIEWRRDRREVAPDPAAAGPVRWIRRRPDVGAEEMRAAGIFVADALNEREPSLVEDVLQSRELRMQTERLAAGVAADLQHRAGRNRQRRPPAVIERIGVRHEHAEAVVAPAQIQHDEIAAGRALRAREVGEKCGRSQADGESGHAVLHERASGDHTNWYSADPRIKWTRPDPFVCSCASDPVHAPPVEDDA